MEMKVKTSVKVEKNEIFTNENRLEVCNPGQAKPSTSASTFSSGQILYQQKSTYYMFYVYIYI